MTLGLRPGWVLWVGSAISGPAPSGLPMTVPLVSTLVDYLIDTSSPLLRGRHSRVLAMLVIELTGGSERQPFEVILGEIAGHTGTLLSAIPASASSGAKSNATHTAVDRH